MAIPKIDQLVYWLFHYVSRPLVAFAIRELRMEHRIGD